MAFFDVFAMPGGCQNKDEAYQFLNYLLRPDVVAHISDHVFYANANKAATPLVSAEVRDNLGIYPPGGCSCEAVHSESAGPENRPCAHPRVDQSEERKIIRSRRCRTGAPHPPAIRTIMVRLHTFNAGEQP